MVSPRSVTGISQARLFVNVDNEEESFLDSSSEAELSEDDRAELDQATEQVQMDADIFSHAIVSALRKGFQHPMTMRGFFLVFITILSQISAVTAFTSRSWGYLSSFSDDLSDAMTEYFNQADYVTSPLADICGHFHRTTNLGFGGYGKTYRMTFNWASEGQLDTQIKVYRYMLQWRYTLMFFLMVNVWVWRCTQEMRAGVRVAHAFLCFDEIDYDLDSSCVTPAGDGVQIVKVTRCAKYWALLFSAFRIILATVLTIDGYFLLITTDNMIDLMLNALALEFIFSFGVLIAAALLDTKELSFVSAMAVFAKKEPMTLFREQRQKPLQTTLYWRHWTYVRLIGSFLLCSLFMIPRHALISGLHRRALTLCITRGLTDGTRPLPPTDDGTDDDVVFPIVGFCETLVGEYSGLEAYPECTLFRYTVLDKFRTASCKNVGDLETASWATLPRTDYATKDVCMQFWFGSGLPAGAKVPALHDPSNPKQDPLQFGCRRQDLEITTDYEWWEVVGTTNIKCHRPALGPKSLTWGLTPADSGRYIPATNFFQSDAFSPIEYQVSACDPLEHTFACHGDPCFSYVDNIEGKTCQQFCDAAGLDCIEAFNDKDNQCKIKSTLRCDERIDSFDALCRCQLKPEKRVCSRLKAAFRRCDTDPCKVLVGKEDVMTGWTANFSTCGEYCTMHGRVCVSQYEVKKHTCDPVAGAEFTCGDPIVYDQHSIVPFRVCQCA